MRRSTKPFTVEVKRPGRKKSPAPAPGDDQPDDSALGRDSGWDIRFREAETLFRGEAKLPPEEPAAPPQIESAVFDAAPEPEPAAPPRRILPDLVAEAAISEQAALAAPAPRRRGRPPKVRSENDPLPLPRRPRAPEPATWAFEAPQAEPAEIAIPAPPAFATFEASPRRRAARASTHLPRGERWKRRLPKVCW